MRTHDAASPREFTVGTDHAWSARRTMVFGRFLSLASISVALTAASGCVVSPQPLPPGAPLIDVSKLTFVGGATGTIGIHGAPGAVTPKATLGAVAPTGHAGPANAAVAADGSFDVSVELDPANVYRLEAQLHGLFSSPVDVSVPAGFDKTTTPAMEAAHPYAGCLALNPGPIDDRGSARVGHPDPFAVELENGCTFDITADDVRLRTGSLGFTLTGAPPLTIPAGQVRAISLQFDPAGKGPAEDLLVVHLAGATPGFLFVTLRGVGTP